MGLLEETLNKEYTCVKSQSDLDISGSHVGCDSCRYKNSDSGLETDIEYWKMRLGCLETILEDTQFNLTSILETGKDKTYTDVVLKSKDWLKDYELMCGLIDTAFMWLDRAKKYPKLNDMLIQELNEYEHHLLEYTKKGIIIDKSYDTATENDKTKKLEEKIHDVVIPKYSLAYERERSTLEYMYRNTIGSIVFFDNSIKSGYELLSGSKQSKQGLRGCINSSKKLRRNCLKAYSLIEDKLVEAFKLINYLNDQGITEKIDEFSDYLNDTIDFCKKKLSRYKIRI